MKNQEVKNSNESSLSQKALDVISRQAALDCFHDWIDRHGDVHTPDEMAEYRAIEELPSAQPYTEAEIQKMQDLEQAEIQKAYECGRASAQPEQQWVLVKEKLPEEDKDVLVTVHFLGLEQKRKSGWIDHIKPCYYVDIASHIDGEWSSASDEYKVARNRHIVIAWKELPEPYRGEGENG